jgi:iron complex transport system ATP-binding protein
VLLTTLVANLGLCYADRAYLLRGGERLAEGPVQQILTRERLEALYGAPVQTITDATGTAFIPG